MEKRSYQYYSEITSKEVEWLWYPYIPYGKITILQGDPGDGKSTFALNVAAIVTRGDSLPDGGKIESPQTVIYQCAEDGMEDTIKPRLVSADANCSRVAFIDSKGATITLDDARIEQAIMETGARLLILDPLQAFLDGDSNMRSAAKMRVLLSKLSDLAKKYNCAVLLIGHMTKAEHGKSLYRGLGSIDIAALARSVLMITRDEKVPEIRYMIPVKSSLAPEGPAIGFTMSAAYGFQWIGRCSVDMKDTSVSSSEHTSKKEKAINLLEIMLSAEDVPSVEVIERMRRIGIGERTVRTAQKELGVQSYRKNNMWYLSMNYEETTQESLE